MITSFTKEYAFLSNMYVCDVEYNDYLYQSSEHAYQAAKATNTVDHNIIASQVTGKLAKIATKNLQTRSDWFNIRLEVMEKIITAKFLQNPHLKIKLLNTKNMLLVEGNWWGDRFWGESPVGLGANNLGIILMKVRSQLDRE